MAFPGSSSIIVSAGGTLLLVRVGHANTLHFPFATTFFWLFATSVLAKFLYDVILYPILLSPLRKLPHPSVSTNEILVEREAVLRVEGQFFSHGTI